eukprot:TRINITY_DN23989_c0_g1_i1.p2 TRINITY_DN23989_c0_g1~~TRINITY_DN23989_c0_g1_i1.p2  ORF type:complete len:235 (+),score=54.15 TRINITY_DN23989_c0_g1_i1:96-800(+)
MAKRKKPGDDLPAAVLRSGGVVPDDVAGEVKAFAGGALEHLSAIKKAALSKILDKTVADIRKSLAEQPPDKTVFVATVTREDDAFDEFKQHLQKRMPEANVYYAGTKPRELYVVVLRAEAVAKNFMKMATKRAHDGYNNLCMNVVFDLPVCALHPGEDEESQLLRYGLPPSKTDYTLPRQCEQKLAAALTAEGLPLSPPDASPRKRVRLANAEPMKYHLGSDKYQVNFRLETYW